MLDYKLTLGPCLFNWKVNDWRDFYFKIAEESPLDEVYLGEVVCYKRYPFFEVAMEDVIERLRRAKKTVHFSSFSLILSDLELKTSKKIIENNDFSQSMIEVNDVGLLGLLKNKSYIIGPTVNVYNEGTMKALISQGAKRFCFPYEIDKESLEIMGSVDNAEKEMFVFGRMPLAIAARCYHARIHNTTKDDCRYVCEKDYNAKVISTLSDENFLAVNGTQTMSYSYVNLIEQLQELKSMGINVFRISPHYMDMIAIISIFKGVLDGKVDALEARDKMMKLMPEDLSKNSTFNKNLFSNGFYFGKEGRNLYKNSE